MQEVKLSRDEKTKIGGWKSSKLKFKLWEYHWSKHNNMSTTRQEWFETALFVAECRFVDYNGCPIYFGYFFSMATCNCRYRIDVITQTLWGETETGTSHSALKNYFSYCLTFQKKIYICHFAQDWTQRLCVLVVLVEFLSLTFCDP